MGARYGKGPESFPAGTWKGWKCAKNHPVQTTCHELLGEVEIQEGAKKKQVAVKGGGGRQILLPEPQGRLYCQLGGGNVEKNKNNARKMLALATPRLCQGEKGLMTYRKP